MGTTINEYILVELFKESKMPIDRTIETIAYIASTSRNILSRLEREACANAISTMRKYQKIVPALVNYDLLNPIADVKTIDGEGIYINLSDLQDYIQKVVEE